MRLASTFEAESQVDVLRPGWRFNPASHIRSVELRSFGHRLKSQKQTVIGVCFISYGVCGLAATGVEWIKPLTKPCTILSHREF